MHHASVFDANSVNPLGSVRSDSLEPVMIRSLPMDATVAAGFCRRLSDIDDWLILRLSSTRARLRGTKFLSK